jgi:glutamine amidotransferase
MTRPAVSIAVIDSGSGNLRSVQRALARAGGNPIVTSDPDLVRRADRVVVPGQGAFADCRRALRLRGLDEAILEAITGGRPYLGICLGLQVLFDESEEHGPVSGLGVLPGKVVKFRGGDGIKVPHIGWNQVRAAHEEPLMVGIADNAYFYFVHSYHVVPRDPAVISLWCDHGGPFVAAVRQGNLFACQFHPEKSQADGLRLLEAFVERA